MGRCQAVREMDMSVVIVGVIIVVAAILWSAYVLYLLGWPR